MTIVERIRGRRGVAIRQAVLRQEPLCRACLAQGRYTASEEVDHIVPLHKGGTNDRDNLQGLCIPCHAVKTATEDSGQQAAANHPEWLKLSAVPLTIVCGPPASGKSTYVSDRAGDDDLVIDLDAIARSIDPVYEHWRGMLTGPLLNGAIRVRNALLGSLARRTHGRAWFIVSAPTQAERNWWRSKLGGEVVLLDPGIEECKRRAVARGTPDAVAGVDAWYRKSRAPWQPSAPRRRIGLDGWPAE